MAWGIKRHRTKAHKNSRPLAEAIKPMVESLEQRMLLSDTASLLALPVSLPDRWVDDPILFYPTPIESPFTPVLYAFSHERGQIVPGPDGSMWFTEPRAGKIGRLGPNGDITEFPVSTASDSGSRYLADSIARGDDGNFYFAMYSIANGVSGWQIGRITPDGQITALTERQPSGTDQIVLGGDGHIWFGQTDGKIGRLNADNTISQFPVPGATGMAHVATATDGSIWFVAYDKRNIFGKIAADGTVKTFDAGSFSTKYVNALVAAPDGSMYLAGDGAIAKLSPDGQMTVTSLPQIYMANLAVAPDGTVWFIDGRESLNPLARLNPDGTVLHTAIDNPQARIGWMTFGPDGLLYLTATNNTAIQRLRLQDGIFGQAVRFNAEHRKEFTGKVGSFVDYLGTPASDYKASLNWGDGQTSQGSAAANGYGGYDIVATGTLRRGWHTITITVTDGDRTGTFHSTVYVVPPAIAGTGVVIEPTAGQVFTGTAATFVGLDTDHLDWYTPTINWGDGETSTGQLIVGENDVVRIVASHTYAKPGRYDTQVYVLEENDQPPLAPGQSIPVGQPIPTTTFNDARGRAVVAWGLMDGKITGPITTGLMQSVAAEFTLADPTDTFEHYWAVIQWSANDLEEAAIQPIGSGKFIVLTSRVFLDPTYRPVTVLIYDANRPAEFGTVGIACGSIPIQSHLTVAALPFTTVAGELFQGIVGKVSSIGSGSLWSSEFTATINWGDGTTSPGQVVPDGRGGWDILGIHTYPITGRRRFLSATIRVDETRTPLDPTLPTPTHTSAAVGSTQWGGVYVLPGDIGGFVLHTDVDYPPRATAGERANLMFATLTAQDPAAMPDDFTGMVVWDDGGTSPVRMDWYTYDFAIYTQYMFATGGNHHGTLTITSGDVVRTADVVVEVREPLPPPPPPRPSLAQLTAYEISAVRGVQFTGLVATFIPRDADLTANDFKAVVYSFDGSSSEGMITAGENGTFIITIKHTYYHEISGWFNIVLSHGSESVSGRARLEVKRDPSKVYIDGRSGLNFRQREPLTTKVASFTPIAGATIDQYEATIDWGDGTITQGAITPGYGGALDISGTTTYQRSGTFTIKVTVKGPGGPVEGQSFIYLARDPVIVTPLRPVVSELTVSGPLASFTDEDGGSTLDYEVTYAALVDWGDGNITSSTVDNKPDGTHEVSASHVYASAGDYRVRLIVRRNQRWLPQLPAPPGYSPSYTFRVEWSGSIFDPYGRNVICDATSTSVDGHPVNEYAHTLFTLHVTGEPAPVTGDTEGGGTTGQIPTPPPAHKPKPHKPKPARRPIKFDKVGLALGLNKVLNAKVRIAGGQSEPLVQWIRKGASPFARGRAIRH